MPLAEETKKIPSCAWTRLSIGQDDGHGSGDPTLVVAISLTAGFAAVLVAVIVVVVACVWVQRAKIKYDQFEDKVPWHQVVPVEGGVPGYSDAIGANTDATVSVQEVQEQEVQEAEMEEVVMENSGIEHRLEETEEPVAQTDTIAVQDEDEKQTPRGDDMVAKVKTAAKADAAVSDDAEANVTDTDQS